MKVDDCQLYSTRISLTLLAKSVLKEDGLTFSFAREEFLANGSYFILYQAQSILLDIQSNVTRISLKQAIEKRLEVQSDIDVQLFLVLLCTDKIPLSARSMLLPGSQNPLWQTLDSTVCAERCIVIFKDGINFSKDEANQHFDPLVVLALYFSDDEGQKQKLQNIGDPMTQFIDASLIVQNNNQIVNCLTLLQNKKVTLLIMS